MSQETISNERNNLNNSNFHSNSYTVYNHIYSKTDQQQPEETSFKPIERKGLQINFFFLQITFLNLVRNLRKINLVKVKMGQQENDYDITVKHRLIVIFQLQLRLLAFNQRSIQI